MSRAADPGSDGPNSTLSWEAARIWTGYEAFSDGVFAVAITILALNLSLTEPGSTQPSLAGQLAAR